MSNDWFYSAGTPPFNACTDYATSQGTVSINGGAAIMFLVGACPWIWSNVGVAFGFALWIVYPGVGPTPFFIQYTMFGVQTLATSFAMITATPANFTGSYTMSNGDIVTFGP